MKLAAIRLLAPSILALGLVAHAERPAPPPAVTRHLDFDDDKIEGDVVHPDDAFVGGRTRPRFSHLIRIRANFLAELIRSTEDR